MEACTKCVAERCCTARDACRADDDCNPLKDCYGACRDAACEDACFAAHDSSIGHVFALIGCVLIRCGDECGDTPNDCSKCTSDQCGDALIDCQSDHDCYLLSRCLGPCADFACIQACNAKYPGGVERADALLQCGTARCSGPCRR